MSIKIEEARSLLLESPERWGEYKKGNVLSKSSKADYLFNYDNDKAASSNDTNADKIRLKEARKLLDSWLNF